MPAVSVFYVPAPLSPTCFSLLDPSTSLPDCTLQFRTLMPRIDFFNFFRYALGTVVTVYATVVSLQSLWGWYVWLMGTEKYVSLLRRYVILHGLRLRFRTFWGDVLVCLLLCVAFLVMWHAHLVIYDLGDKVEDVRRLAQIP